MIGFTTQQSGGNIYFRFGKHSRFIANLKIAINITAYLLQNLFDDIRLVRARKGNAGVSCRTMKMDAN